MTRKQNTDGQEILPAWAPCQCDEFWCSIHQSHVFECECPPIDDWLTDPYASPKTIPNHQPKATK